MLASVGIFLSGTIAYLCCRRFGVALARRIAGEAGLERVREGMRRLGPLTIAVTRSVPVVQEATACLAGLTEMPARSFFGSLAAGSVPTGFAYAAIGASALQSEGWALALSLLVPALTWPVIYWVLRSARNSPGAA
ncbi:MAG: VTT domain-containing protein [Verrucomicrobia bacterium]|nr:VTT domain-containing protein [Verrucomicrobiota bacterium]